MSVQFARGLRPRSSSSSNCLPDKNTDVQSLNRVVEHGKGNRNELRNDHISVEGIGEEPKDASIKYEYEVHALNLVTRKLGANCNQGRDSEDLERSNTKSINTEEGDTVLALMQAEVI